MSRIGRGAVVFAALIVGACAAVALRNPPQVDVAAVALDRIEGPDAYFIVDLVLTNRTDAPLVVDALDGKLAIEGEGIAEARLIDGPVRLAPNGTASAQLGARTGMDAILRAVAAAMRRGATLLTPGASPVLHYTLSGSAKVAGGGRFTFNRTGELGERKP